MGSLGPMMGGGTGNPGIQWNGDWTGQTSPSGPGGGQKTTMQNLGNFGSSVSDFGKRAGHMPNAAGVAMQPMPQMPGIVSPVTGDQIAGAQNGVGNSLSAQNDLLAALRGKNGAANQSAVLGQGQNLYGQLAGNNGVGTQAAATRQQEALNSQLGGANGVGTQQQAIAGLENVYGQQQGTANQLQGIANGTGPNPAQAALNQATGQNVANQAALMAGQRGAGANVGLMARQAAQQGAATQQQAAGQGATMQAQQEMNALGQLTGQQQAMAGTAQGLGGLGAGLVGQQQAGIGQQFGQGVSNVGQQQAQQGINAGIAQNQVGNQIGVTNQEAGNQIANQGQVLGAAGQYNADITSGQNSVNAGNTAMNVAAQKGRQDIFGGLMNNAGPAVAAIGSMFGGGAAAGGAGAAGADVGGAAAGDSLGADAAYAGTVAARGGMVGHQYADGGTVDQQPNSGPSMVAAPMVAAPVPVQAPQGPQSSFGQFLAGKSAAPQEQPSALKQGTTNAGANLLSALGGARGGMAKDFRGGGGVKATSPDEKAVKPGNSYANDKVKAVLSEGEVVIPRSVMQSKNPAKGAADFVSKVLAKRSKAS